MKLNDTFFFRAAQVTMPGIRPLETLHNALSLRQLDSFLGFVTSASFIPPDSSDDADHDEQLLFAFKNKSNKGDVMAGGKTPPSTPTAQHKTKQKRDPPLPLELLSRESSKGAFALYSTV